MVNGVVRRFVCVVVALALTGCMSGNDKTDEPDNGSSTSSSDTSTGGVRRLPLIPDANSLGLVDCQHSSSFFQYLTTLVQASTPPGYQISNSGSPVTASVGIHVLNCDGLVLSNQSVLGTVNVAWVFAGLADERGNVSADGYLYAFEIFSDSSDLIARLSSWGMYANPASISVDSSSDVYRATISVNGADWYDLTAEAGQGSISANPYRVAFFQENSGVGHGMLYDASANLGAVVPYATRLAATAGFLQSIPPGSLGMHVGQSYLGLSSGTLSNLADL